MEFCISQVLGEPTAYNTYQIKTYNNYKLAGFSKEAKQQYRDTLERKFAACIQCRQTYDGEIESLRD